MSKNVEIAPPPPFPIKKLEKRSKQKTFDFLSFKYFIIRPKGLPS